MTEIKYKAEVIGKGGIAARIVAHSKSAYSGKEIVTWEYESPKCILAETNTHRVFSRNAQSSRAVPVAKIIDQIRNNPVTPIYWGSNKPGMVAGEEIDNKVFFFEEFLKLKELGMSEEEAIKFSTFRRDDAWEITARQVSHLMQAWEDAGYHKQIVNRIGEAFTFIKGVITSTEFDNFFHLRIHPAADPFMAELARCMWEAYQLSEPEVLYEGEWHTPYVWHFRDESEKLIYGNFNDYPNSSEVIEYSLERALEVSAAGTAQVSFRKLDLSDETVDRVYSRLVDEETPHASCVEHQATPMTIKPSDGIAEALDYLCSVEGVTHLDEKFQLWSGNFMGWIQNRKLIPNESCSNYKG